MEDLACKICTKCGKEKSLGAFKKSKRTPDGRSYWCRECFHDYEKEHPARNKGKPGRDLASYYRHRLERRCKRYGISVQLFQEMYTQQHGGCAICGKPISIEAGNLRVDHDHACCPARTSCGKCVRGLLCVGCNAILGLVADSVDKLKVCITYLEERCQQVQR